MKDLSVEVDFFSSALFSKLWMNGLVCTHQLSSPIAVASATTSSNFADTTLKSTVAETTTEMWVNVS
jgi:hypothetical protein